MKSHVTFAALAVAVTLCSAAHAGPTLDAVKKSGMLSCGVSTGLTGFSQADSQGRYTGLDVDVCRMVAAAVLGDASKVKFVPLSSQQRFTAIQSGEVDILSRTTTWTLQRDTQLGLNFAPVVFYDGQGFMVPKKLGLRSAKELKGATVCVQPGTTTELNLADFFRANKLDFKPVVIEKLPTARGWRRRASARRRTPTITSSCPRSSRRSRWRPPSDMAMTNGSTSSNGRSLPASRRKRTGSPRRMSMTRSRPTTPTSSASSA